MCTINDNHTMYGSWDMECNRQNFLSFRTIFCPPPTPTPHTPLTTWNIKILKKMEKLPGDIIILHRCNINYNHVMYGSWDTERVRQNLLPFWSIFCTLIPLTTRKILILKNKKKKNKKPHGDIITLHMCTINDNHMMYGSWDMEHDRQNFLLFWTFFCLFYAPKNSWNQNFEKMKKTTEHIIILNMCTINDNHMMYGSWDIKHDRPNFLLFWNNFCPFTP